MNDEKEPNLVTIIVNARPHDVPKGEISFDDVVRLAFGETTNPQAVYTITYERGESDDHDGILPAGRSVKVKKDMVFNVSATGQS